MRVRFPLLAPEIGVVMHLRDWACAGVGEPGQTVNLLALLEKVRLLPLPPKIKIPAFAGIFIFDRRGLW